MRLLSWALKTAVADLLIRVTLAPVLDACLGKHEKLHSTPLTHQRLEDRS